VCSAPQYDPELEEERIQAAKQAKLADFERLKAAKEMVRLVK
jgi:hypothetical protein